MTCAEQLVTFFLTYQSAINIYEGEFRIVSSKWAANTATLFRLAF